MVLMPPARAVLLLLTKRLCHIKSFVSTWEPAWNWAAPALPSALPSALAPRKVPSPGRQFGHVVRVEATQWVASRCLLDTNGSELSELISETSDLLTVVKK